MTAKIDSKTTEHSGKDTNGNSKEGEPKKPTAAWTIELDTALVCDRKGKEVCKPARCWKVVDPVTGEVIHHPINNRDASFWVVALVCTANVDLCNRLTGF